MTIAVSAVFERPFTVAAACAVFFCYSVLPMPKALAAIGIGEADQWLFISIFVGLLAHLAATTLVWLRFSWPRWLFAFLALYGPVIEAVSLSTIQPELSFYEAIFALLVNDWEPWLLLASAALLFFPSSNIWFKEKEAVVT